MDWGTFPQTNLRQGTAHGYVPQYFSEIFYIIRNVHILPITFPAVIAFQAKYVSPIDEMTKKDHQEFWLEK